MSKTPTPEDLVEQIKEDIRKSLEEQDKRSGPKFSVFDQPGVKKQQRQPPKGQGKL